ncbi:hypothetical protein AB0K43_08330 [Kitasatospora sp. NPDC049258]|uniref:hypothetical protein n=1 Tax=Kitasatospora sp. NPDC049258 TaxID=3155394 RepID=UPI00344172C4
MEWWSRLSGHPRPEPEEFLALFLDRTDLPGPLHLICPPQGRRPPELAPPLTGVVTSGAAVWAAPGDAALHRIDDLRWLFARPRHAALAAGRLRTELRAPAAAADRVLLLGLVVARLVCAPGQDAGPPGPALAELAARAAARAAASPLAGHRPRIGD